MTYGYSIKDINETRAHAVMQDVPISYKTAVMVAQKIKGMQASKALAFLADVQRTRRAVPFTKFNDSIGHKPGSVGPGRYPEKAAKLFEGLIKNAVANAEDRDLGNEVWIEFVVAQQASRPWHPGRVGRRRFKRSHVELVVTNAPHPRAEKKSVRKELKAVTKKEMKNVPKQENKKEAPKAAQEN